MQTQSFILLNVREPYVYSVRQNTAGAKKKEACGMRVNILLTKTILASELKVTCCSLSRSRAALPLNVTHSLASLKSPRGKGKVLS